MILPHVLAPHLLWVVTSLLCAAVSGRLLAESLEAEDPTEESVWLAAAAFVVSCAVCVLAIWATA